MRHAHAQRAERSRVVGYMEAVRWMLYQRSVFCSIEANVVGIKFYDGLAHLQPAVDIRPNCAYNIDILVTQ